MYAQLMNYDRGNERCEFPPCSWSYVDSEGQPRHIVYVYGTSFKNGNELPAAGCGVSFGKIAENNLSYGLEDDMNPEQALREVQDTLQAESAGLYLAFSEILLRRTDGNKYEIRTNSHKSLELLETWKKLTWENYIMDSWNGNKAADFTVRALQVEDQLPNGAVTLKVIDPKVDEEGIDSAFNLAWDGIDECLNRRRSRQTNKEWKDKFIEETVEEKTLWGDV
ncbi:hypothetical protein B0I73DRAFT_160861 [Yarrowia lipolytica]|uniref:Uncharacterized protein n=1 Tax=Yarrowia lipolytica TaxID=4952 RepID=A0A371C6J3_YARLL|nr:hypothetical protein B0I71DRAFT_82595 [Yarrowia lipolytica]RDW37732.1 hypothetical protein B0I73DRAFT_160861 [Yarrowia lipolytica]